MKVSYIYKYPGQQLWVGADKADSPVATIVSEVKAGYVIYGVAWLNEQIDTFNKQEGMRLATKVMEDPNRSASSILECRHTLRHADIMFRVLMDIYITDRYPYSKEVILLDNINYFAGRVNEHRH